MLALFGEENNIHMYVYDNMLFVSITFCIGYAYFTLLSFMMVVVLDAYP